MAAALRPLRETLYGGAFEMAELAGMAERLQTTIAALGAAAGEGVHSELMTDCQSADALCQRLSGMAMFLACLANAAADSATIDAGAAARGLPLAEQAARLGGVSRPANDAEDPSDALAGDLELFDG